MIQVQTTDNVEAPLFHGIQSVRPVSGRLFTPTLESDDAGVRRLFVLVQRTLYSE
jgi:hypothetical protein